MLRFVRAPVVDYRRGSNGVTMSNGKLPDGVPFDNETSSSFGVGDGEPRFKAPEPATPKFAPERELIEREEVRVHHAHQADHYADDEESIRLIPSVNPTVLLVVLSVLLFTVAAIVVTNSRDGLPNCASQPEWNQYNCRAN